MYQQVTVFYSKKPKSYVLTPRRKRVVKPLVRRSHCTVVRHCLKDLRLRNHLISGIGQILQKEVASLCSGNTTSLLNDKSVNALETFSWDDLLDEIESRSPTLLALMKWCTKTKKPRKNKKSIIAFLVAILCRHRRPTFSIVQRLISMILYSGHASKRVRKHC